MKIKVKVTGAKISSRRLFRSETDGYPLQIVVYHCPRSIVRLDPKVRRSRSVELALRSQVGIIAAGASIPVDLYLAVR